MRVSQLVDKLALRVLTPDVSLEREVKCAYAGDLLSFVMAKGNEGTAWVTVQTHMNVIAVACLHDFSCVIISESGDVPTDVLDRATEEKMPVLQSELSTYSLCGALCKFGVG